MYNYLTPGWIKNHIRCKGQKIQRPWWKPPQRVEAYQFGWGLSTSSKNENPYQAFWLPKKRKILNQSDVCPLWGSNIDSNYSTVSAKIRNHLCEANNGCQQTRARLDMKIIFYWICLDINQNRSYVKVFSLYYNRFFVDPYKIQLLKYFKASNWRTQLSNWFEPKKNTYFTEKL